MNTQRPKIAVIGAGWAGLSAAVSLIHRADIALFVAGRQAGGRAFSYKHLRAHETQLTNT